VGDRDYQDRLERLLTEIEADMRLTARATGMGRLSGALRVALRTVPRHEFVPQEAREAAYANVPLPIGDGQTISQPFIVALMTELLDLAPSSVVLEIGAGSGYQAAVLSCLAARVYTMELRRSLADAARERLIRLGYRNVAVAQGDGYLGWPEHAPFDAIIVTAAAPTIPPALVEQLAPGGRMAIPVGEMWGPQKLRLVTKDAQGRVEERDVLDVAFVPLVPG